MRPVHRLGALLVTLAVVAACAVLRTSGGVADVPGARLLADVQLPEPLPEDVRPLWLTIYPTPQRASYGASLLPLEGAERIDDSTEGFDARLEELGWDALPREGYVLTVEARGGHAVVLLAARDDAGRRWAEQALSQVTCELGGKKYLRECEVVDFPIFPLRGSRRPLAWESRYRANFAWGAKDDADARGRAAVAVYAPGIPLDASGAGVARALEFFRAHQDRGVRLCAIRFDDESFALTPESERHYGSFGPALVSYVRLLRQGLRRRDAEARLYIVPQTYAWDDPRLEVFARAIRDAGGFDDDVGLVFTGPEAVCERIDAPGLAQARRTFGLTETKALIHDVGRAGDWGPLTGRDTDLARYADGVFCERGTPVNRLTRLDWLWNPLAYDAERSWRRAILEIAGPRDFESVAAICAALRNGAARQATAERIEALARAGDGTWQGALPRRDLLALLRADCERLPAAPSTAVRGELRSGN